MFLIAQTYEDVTYYGNYPSSYDSEVMLWGSIIVAILFISSVFFFNRYLRRYRIIRDTPTSKCRGVFIGYVELKGTAESTAPLTSFLSETTCVYYAWTIQERWSRWVTRTTTDSKGNVRTYRTKESGWTTVAKGGESPCFYLKDDSDAILVDPEGASLDALMVFNRTVTPLDDLYFGKGPDIVISDSDRVRCFTETAIPLHHSLYLLGQAKERSDIVAPMIAQDKTVKDYIISVKSEESYSTGLRWSIMGIFFVSALAVFGFYGFMVYNYTGAENFLYVAGALFIVIFFFLWVFSLYNNVVSVRNRVHQAMSLIDVQYKRRFDLIPNLVTVVTALRDYERECLEALTLLRTRATPQANGQSVMGAIQMIKEAYPELHSNENFIFISQALVDAEDRIALATMYYNDVVTNYNTLIQCFPEVLVSTLLGMKSAKLYEIGDIKRSTVQVDFSA